MKTQTKEEMAEIKRRLKRFAPKGSTLYCVTTHVSASGMVREITVLAIVRMTRTVDGKRTVETSMVDVGPQIGALLGWKVGERGLRVGGCGMDMHFHTVYEMSRALYGDGYAVKKQSP